MAEAMDTGLPPKTISKAPFLPILMALVKREFLGQYRRSLLGPFWAILQPLAYLLLFLFLRSVINFGEVQGPYAVFTFVALSPWSFFVTACSRATPSVNANAGIVKKMPLRKEVFPASAVAATLINLLLSSLILAGLMFWYRSELTVGWMALWAIPLIAILALFALGVGLFFAALGTYKRDISFAIPFLMQFWMLATPIMYPLSRVPEKWLSLYSLNPMVGLIEAIRETVLYNRAPDLTLLGISMVGIAIVWVIAWPIFRYMSQYFADVL